MISPVEVVVPLPNAAPSSVADQWELGSNPLPWSAERWAVS